MKFKHGVTRHKVYVQIDNKRYSVHKASEIIGIHENTLYALCKKKLKPKEFSQHIEDVLWKIKLNLSIQQRVVRLEGHRMCIELLMREAGIARSTACHRINKCLAGEITYAELFTTSKEKLRASIKKASEALRQKRKKAEKVIPGMQPRTNTWDHKSAGSWERENCHQQKFSKGEGGHHLGRNSKGSIYKGD